MALGTLVSRASGFARVVVVTNVLGATYLANVYQSANSIPNLLFELLAAGVLQAVLVPALISALNARGRIGAGQLAGLVMGWGGLVLGLIVGLGIVGAPTIMRTLTSGVSDPVVRADQIRIGTVFLWWFLPQILIYLANTVAVALLNIDGRFALAAVAPVINNVIVIGAYLTFAAVRPAGPVTLGIGSAEQLILAAGTTLGVVAFCAPTILSAARRFPCAPRLAGDRTALRRLVVDGVWALVFVAGTQSFLFVTLLVFNATAGSVAIYQLVWVVFLLPYSVALVPIITTRFPAAARAAAVEDWGSYAAVMSGGVRSLLFLGAPTAGLVIGGAGPVSRLLVRGDVAERSEDIAHGIVAFGVGLVAYALLMFAVRGLYAVGDTLTPAVVNSATAILGIVVVRWAGSGWSSATVVLGVGVVHSLMSATAASVLWIVLARRIRLRDMVHEDEDEARPTASAVTPARSSRSGSLAAVFVRALMSGAVVAVVTSAIGVMIQNHSVVSDLVVLVSAALFALVAAPICFGATNGSGAFAMIASLGADDAPSPRGGSKRR